MENGLIFPYPCMRARGETCETNRPPALVAILVVVLGVGCVGPEWGVVK